MKASQKNTRQFRKLGVAHTKTRAWYQSKWFIAVCIIITTAVTIRVIVDTNIRKSEEREQQLYDETKKSILSDKRIGVPFQLGGLWVTVNSFDDNAIVSGKTDYGYKNVCANITFENKDSSVKDYGSRYWKVQDGNGIIYESKSLSGRAAIEYMGSLAARGTITGEICFSVRDGTDNYILLYNMYPTDREDWTIKINTYDNNTKE